MSSPAAATPMTQPALTPPATTILASLTTSSFAPQESASPDSRSNPQLSASKHPSGQTPPRSSSLAQLASSLASSSSRLLNHHGAAGPPPARSIRFPPVGSLAKSPEPQPIHLPPEPSAAAPKPGTQLDEAPPPYGARASLPHDVAVWLDKINTTLRELKPHGPSSSSSTSGPSSSNHHQQPPRHALSNGTLSSNKSLSPGRRLQRISPPSVDMNATRLAPDLPGPAVDSAGSRPLRRQLRPLSKSSSATTLSSMRGPVMPQHSRNKSETNGLSPVLRGGRAASHSPPPFAFKPWTPSSESPASGTSLHGGAANAPQASAAASPKQLQVVPDLAGSTSKRPRPLEDSGAGFLPTLRNGRSGRAWSLAPADAVELRIHINATLAGMCSALERELLEQREWMAAQEKKRMAEVETQVQTLVAEQVAAKLEEHAARVQAETDARQTAVEQLQQDMAAVFVEVRALSGRHLSGGTTTSVSTTQLEGLVEETRTTVRQQRERQDALAERIGALDAQLNAVNASRQEHHKSALGDGDGLVALAKRVDGAETSLARVAARVAHVDALEARVGAAEQAVRAQDARAADLQRQLGDVANNTIQLVGLHQRALEREERLREQLPGVLRGAWKASRGPADAPSPRWASTGSDASTSEILNGHIDSFDEGFSVTLDEDDKQVGELIDLSLAEGTRLPPKTARTAAGANGFRRPSTGQCYLSDESRCTLQNLRVPAHARTRVATPRAAADPYLYFGQPQLPPVTHHHDFAVDSAPVSLRTGGPVVLQRPVSRSGRSHYGVLEKSSIEVVCGSGRQQEGATTGAGEFGESDEDSWESTAASEVTAGVRPTEVKKTAPENSNESDGSGEMKTVPKSDGETLESGLAGASAGNGRIKCGAGSTDNSMTLQPPFYPSNHHNHHRQNASSEVHRHAHVYGYGLSPSGTSVSSAAGYADLGEEKGHETEKNKKEDGDAAEEEEHPQAFCIYYGGTGEVSDGEGEDYEEVESLGSWGTSQDTMIHHRTAAGSADREAARQSPRRKPVYPDRVMFRADLEEEAGGHGEHEGDEVTPELGEGEARDQVEKEPGSPARSVCLGTGSGTGLGVGGGYWPPPPASQQPGSLSVAAGHRQRGHMRAQSWCAPAGQTGAPFGGGRSGAVGPGAGHTRNKSHSHAIPGGSGAAAMSGLNVQQVPGRHVVSVHPVVSAPTHHGSLSWGHFEAPDLGTVAEESVGECGEGAAPAAPAAVYGEFCEYLDGEALGGSLDGGESGRPKEQLHPHHLTVRFEQGQAQCPRPQALQKAHDHAHVPGPSEGRSPGRQREGEYDHRLYYHPKAGEQLRYHHHHHLEDQLFDEFE